MHCIFLYIIVLIIEVEIYNYNFNYNNTFISVYSFRYTRNFYIIIDCNIYIYLFYLNSLINIYIWIDIENVHLLKSTSPSSIPFEFYPNATLNIFCHEMLNRWLPHHIWRTVNVSKAYIYHINYIIYLWYIDILI